MPEKEWLELINQTEMSVQQHPHEFLGNNLPEKNITREAIRLVFDGFKQDIHIRNVQAFRNVLSDPI